ncbi:glycosyltransferase [Candidatus Margulisiibacteriota bacterium]
MRIAFFADSYKPFLSGVTNSIEILVKELRKLGHQVYIFAPKYPGHVDTDKDIVRFPSIGTHYPKFRLAIPYVNRIPKVDLIHAQTPFQVGLMARYLARREGVPLVYSFHTLFTKYVHYAKFIPEPLSKMSLVTYIRSFCRGANAIITPSELSARVLRSWGVKKDIKIIPSGVEIEAVKRKELSRKLRKSYSVPIDAKVLIYVGRISKEKNLPFLIRAYKKIYKKNSNVYLVMVGGGPYVEKIQKERLPNLILTGEVPYPEVLAHYAMGDVFVFSSLTETQGLVVAEAKAMGLPVVAIFAGALVGTVLSGIDGYLVSRSQQSFVEHVNRLLADDNLRKKMGFQAYGDARDRFSSDKVAKQVERVYNSLL